MLVGLAFKWKVNGLSLAVRAWEWGVQQIPRVDASKLEPGVEDCLHSLELRLPSILSKSGHNYIFLVVVAVAVSFMSNRHRRT